MDGTQLSVYTFNRDTHLVSMDVKEGNTFEGFVSRPDTMLESLPVDRRQERRKVMGVNSVREVMVILC